MTIYKSEGRIYTPKVVDDKKKTSTQPLQECRDCANGCSHCTNDECGDVECQYDCDCESQQGPAVIRVNRRQSRPCSTWALAAICTVTVGLCFLLAGLLYMATKPEFRSKPFAFCEVMYPPDEENMNMTLPETIIVDEEAEIETIDVPRFNGNHPLTVMSDFKIQITAFRDNDDGNCFLLNHTNSVVEEPRNVLEFMNGYRNGDHLTNIQTIYAKMVIEGPEVNVSLMATSISSHCFRVSTFWLRSTEIVDTGAVAKRSAGQFTPNRSFIFFNGRNRVHLDLVK